MNTWEIEILNSVNQLGGEADLRQIYGRLEKNIRLGRDHLRPTRWGGRPAYQHQVRSHISNLCETGQLRWVSRGRYAITAAGRPRLPL
ncbi:MAG: hypothetical protein ACREJ6_04615 [Candidatus Methylomirabilis sp.]